MTEVLLGGGDCEKLVNLDLLESALLFARGDGDRNFVDMLETESEEIGRILFEGPRASGSSRWLSCFRLISSSDLASFLSAIPVLEEIVSGMKFESPIESGM